MSGLVPQIRPILRLYRRPRYPFRTSSMAWVDGYHLPIIWWSCDVPSYDPRGHMRTFHGGTHHFLCYLSPCFMAVSPPKTWFFVFLRNSLFSLFFKKRDFCKNTIFRFFWKKTKFDNFRSVSQRVKYHFSKPRPFNQIKRGQKTTLFLIR